MFFAFSLPQTFFYNSTAPAMPPKGDFNAKKAAKEEETRQKVAAAEVLKTALDTASRNAQAELAAAESRLKAAHASKAAEAVAAAAAAAAGEPPSSVAESAATDGLSVDADRQGPVRLLRDAGSGGGAE